MNVLDLNRAFHCECYSKRIDILNDVIANSEEAIAKALMISEVAHIAKIESRIRMYLINKWRIRANYATKRAADLYANGGNLKQSLSAVDKIMSKFGEDVALRVGKDIKDIYQLARKAGWKKANRQTSASLQYMIPNLTNEEIDKIKKAKDTIVPEIEPSFDLYDEQAILQLQDDQMIWIGDHYDRNVREVLRQSVQPGLIQGKGRKEAGKILAEIVREKLVNITVPGGYHGSDARYFEGLAANIVTNARVRGQVRSFIDIGVTKYTIVNPMDDRTCEVCSYMNGKVFSITDAASLIERVSGATDPDEVKLIRPWMTGNQVKEIGDSGGIKGLSDAGLSLPDYHFRCRCTVDVATESMSFSSLSTEQIASIPQRSLPTRINTPRRSKPTSNPGKKSAQDRPATLPKIK